MQMPHRQAFRLSRTTRDLSVASAIPVEDEIERYVGRPGATRQSDRFTSAAASAPLAGPASRPASRPADEAAGTPSPDRADGTSDEGLSQTRSWDEWAKLALENRAAKRQAQRDARRARDEGRFNSLLAGETALSSNASAYDWSRFESEAERDGESADEGAVKKHKSPRGWFARTLVACLMGIVHTIGISAIFSVFLFICLAATAPLSRSLQPIVTPQMTLLAADGTPIAQSGSDYAEPVLVHDLPPHVIDAVLAIEDRRFYDHFGMDPQGVARAAWRNMSTGTTEGGSTITQQLAKFTYLTPERSLARKAHELLIAFWLETWLTKDEILERYLSNAYFGDNNYGLRSASRNYFGKQPEELNLSEAAMLAGLLKAPSALAPTRHWEKSVERMNVVVEAMHEAGYIDAATATAVAPPRLAADAGERLPTGTHFTDWALAGYDQSALIQPRVTLVTTLDSRLQAIAEDLIANADLGGAEAAMVAMRRNGEVVAMIGGRDYLSSRFNRATMADRQVGSTFKTFVYLAALENGVGPDDPISNRPIETGDYRPKNYDDRYSDFLTVEKAFAHSSNVASVRLYRSVGGAKVQNMARRLGLEADYDSAHPSVALGTPSVSLLELTAGYAGIAANRYPVEPTGFRRAQPNLWDRIVEPPQAFSKETHANMQRLLATSVEKGTGQGTRLPMKAYGKTGTTQGNRDSLFVGYASDLVVGVWVGHDDNRPNPGFSGGGVPARIWKDFMTKAHHLSADKPQRLSDSDAASGEAAVDALQEGAPVVEDRQVALSVDREAPQIGR